MDDPVPVVTEPYVEWVLSGEFPQGRPQWDAVGAPVRRRRRAVGAPEAVAAQRVALAHGLRRRRSVATRPSSRRSPTRSCAAGSSSGGTTPRGTCRCRAEDIAAYRAALLDRYANPRIRHLLRQIAADGSQKVPIRILPTVRAELAAGRVPTGAARVLAAWVCHLRGQGAPVADVAAEEFIALAAGELDDAVGRVLTRLGADDARLHTAVTALARELAANTGATPGNRLPT